MNNIAIRINKVSKFYKLYGSPKDRLKEALHPFHKQYHREFFALKDISLDIGKGEILGVVGKNGSGKSTLLKLICGVLAPSSGSIEVNGKISALLELGAGFNPEFTGRDNIRFYAAVVGLSKHQIDQKLEEIIAFAELGEFIDQPLKSYSSGMKARLSFSVAAHVEPEILILDEVLAVGDILFRRKCFAKMEEFFKGGTTIIFVSHDVNSINELCNRAIFIDNGSIILDGETRLVTTYYQKYLFSQTEKRDEIRKEISKLDCSGKFRDIELHSKLKTEDESYFLAGLVAKSKIEYKNFDVNILGAQIVNKDGEKVNVLQFAQEYKFCVTVEFGIDALDVAFGMEIKEIKGIKIASIESLKMYEKQNHLDKVSRGETFEIEFGFQCLFNAGEYFINFGVSSYSGQQIILNRIIDLYVFKVLNRRGFSGGYLEIINYVAIRNNHTNKIIEVFS